MPIKFSNNNRVLPMNARAVDVAQKSIERILDVQAHRYHAAFRTHGYNGILYLQKKSGMKCPCRSKTSLASNQAGLDASGKAAPGLINQMLTGAPFGIRPYGAKRAPDKAFAEANGIEANHLPSIYEMDDVPHLDRATGSFQDHFSNDPTDPRAMTIIGDGAGPNGPVRPASDDLDDLLESAMPDMPFLGITDVACPICFGTGFVGGYDPYRGFRYVATIGSPGVTFTDGVVDNSQDIPSIACTRIDIVDVPIPKGIVGVDSIRLWNYNEVVPVSLIEINGEAIVHEHEAIRLMRGEPSYLMILLPSKRSITHFEVQFNQSEDEPFFEFPKVTKGAEMTLLENTEPFSIEVSPMIPQIGPKDVITESTYGKALLVGSTNTWNTKQRDVLGWTCEVRVVQPQEMFNLLPRRDRLAQQRKQAPVRDNSSGKRRT